MIYSNTQLVVYAFLGLIIYSFYSYVNFRIVIKFDADIPLWQNFIPLWNGYLVAKQVISKPLLYLVVMVAFFVVGILLGKIGHYEWFKGVANVIVSLLVGNLWGNVAKALGKSYSIYSVLGCLNLFFLIMPMMAFDSSYPIDSKKR